LAPLGTWSRHGSDIFTRRATKDESDVLFCWYHRKEARKQKQSSKQAIINVLTARKLVPVAAGAKVMMAKMIFLLKSMVSCFYSAAGVWFANYGSGEATHTKRQVEMFARQSRCWVESLLSGLDSQSRKVVVSCCIGAKCTTSHKASRASGIALVTSESSKTTTSAIPHYFDKLVSLEFPGVLPFASRQTLRLKVCMWDLLSSGHCSDLVASSKTH